MTSHPSKFVAEEPHNGLSARRSSNQSSFESYWNNYNFLPFDEEQFTAERKQASAPKDQRSFDYSFVDLMPKPFQQGLLEQVAIERALGNNRNLIVSATGTGKTVMAAIDYRNLRKTLGRSRLLFVAHRKEILNQSLHTFRTALKDANFGELWVDGHKPIKWEHVFGSVQSMNAATVEDLQADHFDVVIVDEFHHAAAPTYRKILGELNSASVPLGDRDLLVLAENVW